MESRNRLWTWGALALLACTALIPLTAPVFPTQDGPVHLYYAEVLRGLLTHSGPYTQYFAIKSLLTPYALEYYSLLALETFFSPTMSEKLLVVLYIFVFGMGFRYLVESVAERGSPWILAGIPFCLHALVYMGFLNYSFAVALLLFQCGFWIRHSGKLTRLRVAALLGGLALMLLTHPVPVAVFLVFIGIYFVSDVVQDGVAGARPWKECLHARWKPLVLIMAMAVMAVAWVSLFVDRGEVGDASPNYVLAWGWFNAVATELQLFPVAPFTRMRYRAGPILLMAVTCFMLIAAWRENRRSAAPAAVALIATSSLCFLLFCVVPERVNGSYYFAERFPILWMLFLLAGASAARLPHRWSAAAGGLAAAVTAVTLLMQGSNVSAIGERIALALHAPPAAAGSIGVIVGPGRGVPDGLEFNPYMWSGAHFFRRSQAILANDPWMELPLIMLRPLHPNHWSYLDPEDARESLLVHMAGGAPEEGLDFVVLAAPSDSFVDDLMRRSGWNDSAETPVSNSQFLRIYRRP